MQENKKMCGGQKFWSKIKGTRNGPLGTYEYKHAEVQVHGDHECKGYND